jgi:hypothetical protein
MGTNSGRNEGVRLLDEFSCQAVPAPGAEARAAPPGRGENAGLSVAEELAVDAGGPAPNTRGNS